jgi:phosphohistidine phosphatase SixA
MYIRFPALVAVRLAMMAMAWGASLPVQAQADEALWTTVRSEPNIVLVLRHGEIAPQRGQSGTTYDASGQCRDEVMLSAKGRQTSERVGQIFRERGVRPHVVSSAMCRTRDTAMLAFGAAELDAALRESFSGDQQRFREFLDASTRWILRYRGTMPLVLVMHLPNIDSLTGEQPEHGEMLVARSTPKGELDVLGRIVLYRP